MVAEMMSAIKEETPGELDSFPWRHIVLDRLDELGLSINSKGGNVHRLAQYFLGLPQRKTNPIIQGDF